MVNRDWMIADLHIHSRFSRACSKELNIPNLVKWARIKGLGILGTGDFTHPVWIEELKENLKNNEKGIYFYEDAKGRFPFILSGEISLIYTEKEKGRRVHLVLLVPSIETAEKINSYLDAKGRRDYDGRPIFKISLEDFTQDMMQISRAIEIIPAHIWTPWFGVLGSKGGYDSLTEAFGKQVENIHAIETGISSNPEMNWRIRDLDNKAIVSFSDSHSFWPWRLGREATIFKKTDSYFEIIEQIRKKSFIGTIETDPAYGKYHWDGHRLCSFSCSPEKTKELNNICPKCKNPLTIGVEARVVELAEKTRPEGFYPEQAKKFYSLLPLHELISFWKKSGVNSKGVWDVFNLLIKNFENEFNVLLDVPEQELAKILEASLADLIVKNREGKIKIKPGYDGVYGEVELEDIEEKNDKSGQMTLI